MFLVKQGQEWGPVPRYMHDETFAKFIFSRGKQYRPANLPADIPRMKLKMCFDNAVSIAIDGKYRYVEGLTRDPRTRDRWVLHAWLTDDSGVAYDPTWGQLTPVGFAPILTDYIGIEMPTERVAAFMLGTEYASVFANAWRDPALARECLADLPVEKISSEFFIEIV